MLMQGRLRNVDAERPGFLPMPDLSQFMLESLDTRCRLNLTPCANPVKLVQAPNQPVSGVSNRMRTGFPPRNCDLRHAEIGGEFLRLQTHFLAYETNLRPGQGCRLLKEGIRNDRV